MVSRISIVRKLIFFAAQIARGFRHTHLRISGVKIGQNTMISMGAKIDTHLGRIEIGDNCHITYGCVILGHDGAAKQIYGLDDSSERVAGHVVIEDYVFIGVNSVVLCNVRIGHHSVIGAGSVVRDNIPPYSLAAGNPARVLRRIVSSGGLAEPGEDAERQKQLARE